MAEHTIEQFMTLKKDVTALNSKLSVLEGQRKEKESQLKAILDKHQVKTVEELQAKFTQLQAKADEYYVKADAYLKDMSTKVAAIDGIVAQS